MALSSLPNPFSADVSKLLGDAKTFLALVDEFHAAQDLETRARLAADERGRSIQAWVEGASAPLVRFLSPLFH
jgi:hypothetical protein